MSSNNLMTAAKNAAAVIQAQYQWLERVEAAGGALSMSGVAECNAMLKSMRKNAKRIDDLVMIPLAKAIAEDEGRATE